MSDEKVGLVLYVDGGCRPSRGIGGYGVHGYTYLPEGVEKPSKKRDHTTDVGYLDVPPLEYNAKRIAGNIFTWKDEDRGAVMAVKPIEYHEVFGTLIPESTNNLAEIRGALEALNLILTIEPTKCTMLLDSEYVRLALLERCAKWAKANWLKPDGSTYANIAEMKELYAKYLLASAQCEILLLHIDGHIGEVGNERADTLATRGVYIGFNAIRHNLTGPTDITVITPAALYGKVPETLNRLLAYPRLYTLSAESDHAQKVYNLGSTGPDIAEGKRVSDRGLAVVRLNEPVPLLPKLWDYCVATGDGVPRITRNWLDKIICEEQLSSDAEYIFRQANGTVVDTSGNILVEDCDPPHLAWRLETMFSDLHDILDDTVKGVNAPLVNEVTELFYSTELVKTKTVTSLKPEITQTLKSIALDANVMIKGKIEVVPLNYTFGLSIPTRNTLSAIAVQNPKVYTVAHACSDSSFEYYLVITTDTGDSVWSAYPANLKLIMDASVTKTKVKGKAKKA